MVRIIAVVVAVIISGCGGKAAPAPAPANDEATTPAPTPEPEPEAKRSDRQAVELALKIVGEMVEAAANAGAMCAEMGRSLSGLAMANSDVFDQLGAIQQDPERAKVLDEFTAGMENVVTELFNQVSDCTADPGVSAAMEAMSP